VADTASLFRIGVVAMVAPTIPQLVYVAVVSEPAKTTPQQLPLRDQVCEMIIGILNRRHLRILRSMQMLEVVVSLTTVDADVGTPSAETAAVATKAGATGGAGVVTENVPNHWRSVPVPPDIQSLLNEVRELLIAQEATPFVAGSLCSTRLNKVLSERCPGLTIPISLPVDVVDVFPEGPPVPFHVPSHG
jgi:hypothetical protein